MPLTNATTLSGLDAAGVLPKPLVDQIWKNLAYTSVIQKVSGTTPVSITGNTSMTMTGDLVAGVVGEGEAKPIVNAKPSLKTFSPIKVAAIMYWSKEARIANPSGYLDTFTEELTQAVGRAVDMAVIHGKNALNDSFISGVEYLGQSTNVVELGTAAKKDGGLYRDVLDGYSKVVEADYDFTGFVADPRMRVALMGATDIDGRPVFQTAPNLADGMDTMMGLPVAYGKGVAGKIGAVADTGTRAIGGDFAGNVKLGYVEQINFKRTDSATLIDGGETVPLWQNNLEALLVEAMFSWVIRDVNAFTVYTDKVDEAATTSAG